MALVTWAAGSFGCQSATTTTTSAPVQDTVDTQTIVDSTAVADIADSATAPLADIVTPAKDAGQPPKPRGPRLIPPPTIVPAVAKIAAIGDLHGDIDQTRKVLKLAGAMDDNDQWIGGKLVLVQVGDQLDRGDGEKAILLLLESLADQAHEAGGAIYVLNGNHETMNVALNFSYVTKGGFEDFDDVPHEPDDDLLVQYPVDQKGRVSAFRPGGIYAKVLAGHNTIQVVGENVFVHGGVLPDHVTYGIKEINAEISDWMNNKTKASQHISGDTCPVWSRHYSYDVDDADCQLAAKMLAMLGAKRIVVAHTVQSSGINAACGALV